MKRRSTAPLAGRNRLALCVALALLAGACAAPPLLRGQAAATNPPAPPAASAAEKEAAAKHPSRRYYTEYDEVVLSDLEVALVAYSEDARTNHIRLEKPLYTNAPCSEFRLRAAALAGDGYAASLCSGTNKTERAFWERLAATNGWVPAQIQLAEKLEEVGVELRVTNSRIFQATISAWEVPEATNGRVFKVSRAGAMTERELKSDVAKQFLGAEFVRWIGRSPGEPSPDTVLAKHWRAKALAALPKLKADAGRTNPQALFALALLHDEGDLVQSNQARATELIRQAAEAGMAAAQQGHGRNFERQTNCVEAARWYYLAATQGLASAQSSLASIHGPPGGRNFNPKFQPRAAEAARWFFEVAHQTPGWEAYSACYDLGKSYQSGDGVDSNSVEAVRWFRRAADMGVDEAIGSAEYKLALCYFGGDGVPQNDAEGLRWLKVAHERGYNEYFLGSERYFAGADSQSGLNYLRKLAVQGDAWAQCSLGASYRNGWVVAQNWTEAAKWFRKAADQGDAEAQAALGLMYGNGKGVLRDYGMAIKWLRRAANQGLNGAQNNLGVHYGKGEGVPRDYVEAYKWYNLAGASSDSDTAELAWKNLDIVSRDMTPSQIAEAQRLSREFVARTEQPGTASVNELGSKPAPKATGTAFFITDAGHLLTAAHVVEKAGRIQVSVAGKTYPAVLVKADKANDVAVLKVDGPFKALPLAASRGVKLGDTVFTIGFPNTDVQGTEPKLTKGEISSLAGIQDDPRHFQISAPVQPGNSGGPLVDLTGNVVGLVTARLGDLATLRITGSLPQNVNYALKTSFIIAFLETLPDVAGKLKEPETRARKFDDVVKSAEQSAVLVLVY
jgi:TPR repeat protein